MRTLASHQCGPGSNSGVDAICGLSLLLVLSFAPRAFSSGTPVFPSPQKPKFPNSNSIRERVEEEPRCGSATSKSSSSLYYIIIIITLLLLLLLLLYYILCCKNRNWVSPDLMQFWIFFVWLLFCFVFVFVFCFVFCFLFCFVFFLIIQSQAAFVNCLYEARFTIVHPKTQIKFPLLLLLLLLLLSYYRARNGGGSVAERLELQACKSSEAPSSSLAQLTASRICSR